MTHRIQVIDSGRFSDEVEMYEKEVLPRPTGEGLAEWFVKKAAEKEEDSAGYHVLVSGLSANSHDLFAILEYRGGALVYTVCVLATPD